MGEKVSYRELANLLEKVYYKDKDARETEDLWDLIDYLIATEGHVEICRTCNGTGILNHYDNEGLKYSECCPKCNS